MLAVYSLSIANAAQIAQDFQAQRKTLDAYLERALVQGDREKFEKIAAQGIGAAIAEWEQDSMEKKIEGHDEWISQRNAFSEDLESYKDESLAKWILKKQNEEQEEIQRNALYNDLHEAALAFAYTKSDGSKTRVVSKDFIDEAKAQWSEISMAIVQEYIEAWNGENMSADERELFGLKISEAEKAALVLEAKESSITFLQGEYISIETAITNSLVSALLYDQDSLKKLSDSEAASTIARKLAESIESQTSESMAHLFNEMETELEVASADSLSGAKEQEWLGKFERELAAGLEKWNEAERSFLAARVEWEQNSENIFIDDNKKWTEAYNELGKRKSDWAAKIENQIQEGTKKWEEKHSLLQDQIRNYFEEFQSKLAIEIQQKREIVSAGIETYNQCREILAMAKSGISNSYAKWCEKYNGLYSYWKTEDSSCDADNSDIKSIAGKISEWKNIFIKTALDIIERYLNQAKSSAEEIDESEVEELYEEISSLSEKSSFDEISKIAKKVAQQKNKIQSQLNDSQEEINKEIWQVFEGCASLSKDYEEISAWLELFEQYEKEVRASLSQIYENAGGGIAQSGFDEIENEMAKLSALESYWESREKIALGVYEYSKDYTSGIESADTTEKNLEEALKKYEEKKAEYQRKLGALSDLQAEVKEAQNKYDSAAEDAASALEHIEAQRQIYDELYERYKATNDSKAFDEISALNEKLQKIELCGAEYEKLLLSYYFEIQDEDKKSFEAEIENIKRNFQDGKEETVTENMIDLKQHDILGELEGEAFDLSEYVGLSVKIFSTSEIENFSITLKAIIESDEIDVAALEAILPDLEKFDGKNVGPLKVEIENYHNLNNEIETADESEIEIENADENEETDFSERKAQILENIRAHITAIEKTCQDEIAFRNAVLLLLESENAEKIEEIFAKNPELEERCEPYKKWSFALKTKTQREARKTVSDIIQNAPRGNLEEFFAALDEAGAELDSAGLCILALYKKAIACKSACNINRATLAKNISETFQKEFAINEYDFHEKIFESFFDEKDLRCEKISNPDYSLLNTMESSKSYIEKMERFYLDSFDMQKTISELQVAMENQKNEILNAQKEYEQKIEALRGESSGSALNLYIAKCEEYNAALKRTQDFYAQTEDARREYRAAEEIYFYAQNEYLHKNIDEDLEENLALARQKLSDVRTALEALSEIKAERDSCEKPSESFQEFDEYKASMLQYYRARVLSYEYNKELAAQKERLRQAQLAENAALEALVCEYDAKNEAIPSIVKDFVKVEESVDSEGNTSYSFKLNSIEKISQMSEDEISQNERLLSDYYTNTVATETEQECTKAKLGAIAFLKSLDEKPYSIEDLALALLYLKMQGSDEQKSRWLFSSEDPTIYENYPIGDIPEKVHSMEIWKSFKNGRMAALKDAYEKVINKGGEQDIVNYILYSQTNINTSLDLYERQREELTKRGFENLIKDVESQVDTLVAAAIIQMVIISTFTAIFAIPIFGAWAAVPLAAATIILVSLSIAAAKLSDVKDDIIGLKKGREEILAEHNAKQETLISAWQNARELRKAEEENLKILTGGQNDSKKEKLTWEEFDAALKKFCASSESADYSYYENIHTAEGKNLRELFDTISDDTILTVDNAITKIESVLKSESEQKSAALDSYVQERLKQKEAESEKFTSLLHAGADENPDYKNKLKSAAKSAWGKDSFNQAKYRSDMISFYCEELLQDLPAHFEDSTESYFLEIFEALEEPYIQHIFEAANAQLEIKRDYFSILKMSMQEEEASWQDKMLVAAQIGFEEWEKAEEKINAAYNSWQKEWLDEYDRKNHEWDENYTAFLLDKQEWINQSYLQAGVQEFQAKDYANVSQMKRATKMGDSISEYVASLYDTQKFSRLETFAEKILSFADNSGYDLGIFAFDKIDSSALKNLDEIYAKREKVESDMKNAAAKYQAQMLEAQEKERLEAHLYEIQNQNEQVEDWELDLVRKAGYTVDSQIHRNAIVDSIAFKTYRELQTVHRYEYFEPEYIPSISFSSSEYQSQSEYFILKKMEEMQKEIQVWQEKIFGTSDEKGNSNDKGKLGEHIGEGPEFKNPENLDLSKSLDENIAKEGSGEMGKILADFQWNSLKNSQGYAELSRAIYDQRILPNDGGFHLPTIREAFGIICDILGNCGMAWIKYVDDVVFGAMDLSMGYKSIEEVANQAIRQGLVSAVSSGVSAACNKIFDAAGSAIKQGAQLLGGVKNATVAFSNSVAANYINSFDFMRGTMNWDQANSFWTDASNYTSIAGALVGSALGELNNVDGNHNRLNNAVFKDIEKMNSTIGSLSGAALNYILTGNVSFNLADINGVGLFEVGIKDGEFSAGIGRGGTQLSLLSANMLMSMDEDGNSRLKTSMNDNFIKTLVEGAKSASKVSQLKKGDYENELVNLNAANHLAWSGTKNNIELAKKLFNSEIEFAFEDLENPETLATTKDGKIILGSKLLQSDKDSHAMLAALLASQNALNSTVSYENLRKKDGSEYTAEAIEKMRTDSTLESMKDIATAFLAAHDLLGSEYGSAANAKNIAEIAEVYKEGGETGLFVLYGNILEESKKKMEEAAASNAETEKSTTTTITLDHVMRLDWHQNDKGNDDVFLGTNMPNEEYIATVKEFIANKYACKKLKERNLTGKAALEAESLRNKFKEEALADEELLKANGYDPSLKHREYRLGSFGCTLSTVAYIVYSITGQVYSLKKANEILKAKGVFTGTADAYGISENGDLSIYDGSYVNAINTLAKEDKKIQEDVIVKDGKSVEGNSKEGYKNIFNRIIATTSDTSEKYFIHLRVHNGGHSVLFKSMTYGNDWESATVGVYNPWKQTKDDPESLYKTSYGITEIARADFYKLTAAGKEMYNKRNIES